MGLFKGTDPSFDLAELGPIWPGCAQDVADTIWEADNFRIEAERLRRRVIVKVFTGTLGSWPVTWVIDAARNPKRPTAIPVAEIEVLARVVFADLLVALRLGRSPLFDGNLRWYVDRDGSPAGRKSIIARAGEHAIEHKPTPGPLHDPHRELRDAKRWDKCDLAGIARRWFADPDALSGTYGSAFNAMRQASSPSSSMMLLPGPDPTVSGGARIRIKIGRRGRVVEASVPDGDEPYFHAVFAALRSLGGRLFPDGKRPGLDRILVGGVLDLLAGEGSRAEIFTEIVRTVAGDPSLVVERGCEIRTLIGTLDDLLPAPAAGARGRQELSVGAIVEVVGDDAGPGAIGMVFSLDLDQLDRPRVKVVFPDTEGARVSYGREELRLLGSQPRLTLKK